MKIPIFEPGREGLNSFIVKNGIAQPGEDYDAMITRVATSIANEEVAFGNPDPKDYLDTILASMNSGEFIPSTSILMNAGLPVQLPLGACAVIPADLRGDRASLKTMIDTYHQKGMGTGFNFDDLSNPIEMLLWLNRLAIAGEDSGSQARPVGNMGILTVDHPSIRDFIYIKSGPNKNKRWIFNISVNLTPDFMSAYEEGRSYVLKDGTTVDPENIIFHMANSIYDCGDPGILWLDRFAQSNTVPQLGKQIATAPCGELAMPAGGTCQFGYVNLLAHLNADGTGIDYDKLDRTVTMAVRFLDDALEQSIRGLDYGEAKRIMQESRKIGVGICGFADVLLALGIPYDSGNAIILAEDIMSFFNYSSKRASVELARTRGPFGAFSDPETTIKGAYYESRFGDNPTNTVKRGDWQELDQLVQQYGIRNCSTTALPPTGRSSRVLGVAPQIEPYWDIDLTPVQSYVLTGLLRKIGYNPQEIETTIDLVRNTHRVYGHKSIDEEIQMLFKTAADISPYLHLPVAAAFQYFTDESVSKTINVPEFEITPEEIKGIILLAYSSGLKGITVYRHNSKSGQPERMAPAFEKATPA